MHKTFNWNSVKVSYSFTQIVASIIKSHNKKLINAGQQNMKECNCRKKEECSLEGKSRSKNIVHKCVTAVTDQPQRTYLGTAEWSFKQRYYNHKMSFTNEYHANDNSLSKCV